MILTLPRILVTLGVLWHVVHPGVWQREMAMARDGPLAPVRAVVLRIDPSYVRFGLETMSHDYGLKGAWTIDSLPDGAVVGFNAGQFTGGSPWGWLVVDGKEIQRPGKGTLAMAFVADSAGKISLVMPGDLASVRHSARHAFQSYPALLAVDGKVPWELEAPGRGVNLGHRDSRLAIGVQSDGSLIVALTRFTGLGKTGETIPWGPTVPEMAAFMRSLGCVRAMLLDGGISSQLVVRGGGGHLTRWPNWRPVPLALVVNLQR